MQEELYDYVFKRALAEVDELINLAYDDAQVWQLGEARDYLLLARPENTVELAPKGPDVLCEEKVSEKLEEEEPFSDDPRVNDLYTSGAVSLTHQVGTTQVYLDFTGEWVCENGQRIIVELTDLRNGSKERWVGVSNSDHVNNIIVSYDERGYALDQSFSGWNLKDRIRQGKDYK